MHHFVFQMTAVGCLVLAGCKPEPKIQTYTVPKEQTTVPPMMATGGNMDPTLSPTTPVSSGPATGAPNAGAPSMTATPGMIAQVSGFQTPAWRTPDDWRPKDPGSVRKGSWDIPGASGTVADLSVTVFPGDVGGNLANINRWRQQLGLPPVTEPELNNLLQHVDLPAGHADVVYLLGTDGQSIHGAILPQGNATWFFKMQGHDAVLAAQREAFIEFLQTVSFSPAQ